jgi:hypothetical protein
VADTITISLSGELDATSLAVLEECFAQAVDFQPARVIVDLRAVAAFGSGGHDGLLDLRDDLTELALAPGPGRLNRMDGAAGLLDVFEFVRDDALLPV